MKQEAPKFLKIFVRCTLVKKRVQNNTDLLFQEEKIALKIIFLKTSKVDLSVYIASQIFLAIIFYLK